MESVDAKPVLDRMYTVLKGVQRLRDANSGVLSRPVINLDHVLNTPTEVARSSALVDREKLVALDVKVDKVRNYVFASGVPFNLHPDYGEWISEGWITEDQARRRFFINNQGKFSLITVDLDPFQGASSKLYFSVVDGEANANVEADLKFDDFYDFDVDFVKPEGSSEVKYRVTEKPIDQITADEYINY